MKRNNKTVNNKTGYLILGIIIIVTAACIVGLRISNNRKAENLENSSETNGESRSRKLAPWEKYLYADVEDPTYKDVIYDDNYSMSFEGFEKYQVGKKGDVITYSQVCMPLGLMPNNVRVKMDISVQSVNVYSNLDEIKKSLSDNEKIISIYTRGELLEGCKFVAVELKIDNNNERENLVIQDLWCVQTSDEKYAAEQHKEHEEGAFRSDDCQLHLEFLVVSKDTTFCYNSYLEDNSKHDFYFTPVIGEYTESKNGNEYIMVPGKGSVTYKQIFMVPDELINSEKLTFGTQLKGKGGTYHSDDFCIFLNK